MNSSLCLWYLPVIVMWFSMEDAQKSYSSPKLFANLDRAVMNCCAISKCRFPSDFKSKENLGRGNLCEHHHALTRVLRKKNMNEQQWKHYKIHLQEYLQPSFGLPATYIVDGGSNVT